MRSVIFLSAFLLAPIEIRAESPSCKIVGGVTRLGALPEASGLAASRRTPGVLWSHNDSGDPVVYALTAAGEVSGRIWVRGALVRDWEDIGVSDCPQGTCLYIADIGDNRLARRVITIYRTPEPAKGDAQTAKAEMMNATYPDGPRDAEALIVLPGGQLLIVTKGDGGPIELYRFPSSFKDGATVRLERMATLTPAHGRSGGVPREDRITDADASSDGRWVVLRTHTALTFYEAREFAAGNVREVFHFDVASLAEPQGEGVALGTKGDVWLSGEGGGKGQPGTLARLSCTFP